MTRADALAVIASLVSGYLIGGLPFGYVVARLRGVDIRAVGSGNIGATNVGRALGRPWGLFVLALDISKGLVPVLLLAPFLARGIGSEELVLARTAVGLGTILGHVFTPYLALKGGKGVATSVGVFAALCSYWIAVPLAGYALVRKLSGFVSAGSLTFAVLLPAAALLRHRRDLAGGWPVAAFAALTGALILLRHRSNIARLLKGTENVAPSAASGRDDAARKVGTSEGPDDAAGEKDGTGT